MTWSLHIARFDRLVAPAAPDYAWLCFTPASI
jgi:hypothetical protein